MKTKSVITVLLLLFVVGSVAYMAVKESKGGDADKTGAVPTNDVPPPGNVAPPEPAEAAADPERTVVAEPERTVVAYYFHGDKRCPTCRNLEAYAQEALKAGFAEDLESGRLEWRVVNRDQARNAHFIQDYQLVTNSVVLVELADGEQVRWKNLEQIWDLVGDRPTYLQYIRDNTEAFLGAAT